MNLKKSIYVCAVFGMVSGCAVYPDFYSTSGNPVVLDGANTALDSVGRPDLVLGVLGEYDPALRQLTIGNIDDQGTTFVGTDPNNDDIWQDSGNALILTTAPSDFEGLTNNTPYISVYRTQVMPSAVDGLAYGMLPVSPANEMSTAAGSHTYQGRFWATIVDGTTAPDPIFSSGQATMSVDFTTDVASVTVTGIVGQVLQQTPQGMQLVATTNGPDSVTLTNFSVQNEIDYDPQTISVLSSSAAIPVQNFSGTFHPGGWDSLSSQPQNFGGLVTVQLNGVPTVMMFAFSR